MRVLVVEDDPSFGQLLVGALDVAGHHVELAQSTAAALTAIESAVPDILCVDLDCPESMCSLRVSASISSRPSSLPEWVALPTVLMADDDLALLDAVSILLEASGYTVEVTTSAAETLDRWPRAHPDLLILDLHMPGGGMELVKAISKDTSIPVIVLSADNQEAAKVAALDAGAEDYITKPFAASELLARVRVALRRTARDSKLIQVGSLTLSETDFSASAASATVKLTPTEFDLLKAMALKEGFITTTDLLNDVWGPAYRTELDYVRVYVRRLRSKLDTLGLPNAIESRPGLGYRLIAAGQPPN